MISWVMESAFGGARDSLNGGPVSWISYFTYPQLFYFSDQPILSRIDTQSYATEYIIALKIQWRCI